MDLSKYKSAKKGGAKKVAEFFKGIKKREPSDRLVQIISEVGLTEEEKQKKPDGKAAKQVEI